MVAEIEKTPLNEESLSESNQLNDALRSPPNNFELFISGDKVPGNNENGLLNLKEGGLLITPIFAFNKEATTSVEAKTDAANKAPVDSGNSKVDGDNAELTELDEPAQQMPDDGSSTSDSTDKKDECQRPADKQQPEINEGQDVALNEGAQRAKDDFVQILEARFRADPRLRDNPQMLQELKARMFQMDQRILHERVKCDDGSFIDQQKQLAEEYSNLARIGTDAERLTYIGNDGNEQRVFSEPWMVNNILASGIIRGADPIHFFNQGKNNTCAAESINRQGCELLAGEDSRTIADICTKGEFQAVDKWGNAFMCQVNRASLVPDREAQQIYLTPTNARDAFGQIGDIRTAQLNLDFISMRQGTGPGRYMYCKVSPQNRRDSGERVIDMLNGEVVANSPSLGAREISDVKQSLYGRFIGDNFGKETTIVSTAAFRVLNATGVRNGAELSAHLAALEAKGWKLPTLGTHVGNYVQNANGLGGAEGWHATSIQSGEDGGIDFVNNWGGKHNYKGLDANKLFSWMNAPRWAPAADRTGDDHIFDPDRGTNSDVNPLRIGLAKEDERKFSTNKSVFEQRKEDKEVSFRQMQYAQTKLAQIEGKLAGLLPDSLETKNLLAQKQIYENIVKT